MERLATIPDIRLQTLHLPNSFESPFEGREYVLLLHSDDPNISGEMQGMLSDQIIASGCRYACCSGVACSSWHDSIDYSYLGTDPNYQPPDENFVMTTLHEKESLQDVVRFMLSCTSFTNFKAERFLIVLLGSDAERMKEVRSAVGRGKGGITL